MSETAITKYKFKDKTYYSENKKFFNEKYNVQWKSIAGTPYIGSCSLLFHDFYDKWTKSHTDEPAYEDFFYYYLASADIKDTDNNGRGSINHGRSLAQLIKLAELYRKKCNDNSISLEYYLDNIIIHAVFETFDGQIRECLLKRVFNNKGYETKDTTKYWDADLGVDFVVLKDGVIKGYIQCKPLSTFIGNNNQSLVEDRINFFHKEELKKRECDKHNLPYYKTKFLLYEKNDDYSVWIGLSDEKKSFYLEELCDANGMTLITRDKFVKVHF